MSTESEFLVRLKSLEDRVKKIEQSLFSSSVSLASGSQGKTFSPKEFLKTKIVDSDPKKALVLGYFLEHIRKIQSFNVNDLEEAFRAAKEQLPKNMNATVDKNIAQGFMMSASEKKDSKKAWCLTSTGEKHVENDLNRLAPERHINT